MSELDNQTRQLAAMAYGEASTQNDPDEMSALASVLIRQRDARGYSDVKTFAESEPSFSFVVADGNKRYKKLMDASEAAIEKDKGMKAAVDAAKNALAGGTDKSNGAYFWDGADIKANYEHHFKVKQGIHFTNPEHNIYDIQESTKPVTLYKVVKTKKTTTDNKGKKHITIETKKVEAGHYDHVYDSMAAYGGTIFWKFSGDYLAVTHAKEYK
jgi:hypothetical protein